MTSALGKAPLFFDTQVKQAELDALTHIMSRRDRAGEAPDLILNSNWHSVLDSVPLTDRKKTNAKQWAIGFVRMLSSHYAIVAPVEFDSHGRGFIKYEQNIIPDLTLSKFDRLKVVLGARPIDLSLSLRAASTCQSFHLRVNGGDGIYVGEQQLVDASLTLSQMGVGATVPPHYRFRRRLGQAYAHFYCRVFPEPAKVRLAGGVDERAEEPQVRLKYFETPPGSLLRAAVSAVACLFLVWLVGVVSSRNPDPGTDAPAFLLSLPALVAAWLGFDSPGRRLLEGTMAARSSLLVTVMTSIVASGVFMGHKALDAEAGYRWFKLPTSIFWISDVSWLIINLVALLNVVLVIYLYVKRTAYYTYLISRPQGEEVREHG
jgi:hypothetical protein